MMLAQPAPEANVNAGEQYSAMQLVRHESPAVLYKVMQLLRRESFAVLYRAGFLCSDSIQPLSDCSSGVTTDLAPSKQKMNL